jgi:hypothetical protein
VRQAHEAERGRLLEQRHAVIEGTNPTAGRSMDRDSLAAAVDPGPTSATPLVADAFGRRADAPATVTLSMPDDLPAGATANQTVINGFVASVEELGVSPGWAQKLFDYDGLTLDDEPDPDAPPDAAELDIAREVVELLPAALQNHIRTRRHLERQEFVSTIAKAGALILRRSSAELNDIRPDRAAVLHEGGPAVMTPDELDHPAAVAGQHGSVGSQVHRRRPHAPGAATVKSLPARFVPSQPAEGQE